MKTRNFTLLPLLLATLAILSSCGSKDVSVVEGSVWSRPAKVIEDAMGGMGAVYLTLENSSDKPVRLIGAESDVAAKVEVHEVVKVDGKMTMRAVEGGVEIPAGGKLELKTGSYHIMLIRLKQHLEVGDKFKVTLKFQDRADIKVESVVKEK